MRELSIKELELICGGEGESDTDAVRKNATTAVETCGAGNVKSVSKDGFECK